MENKKIILAEFYRLSGQAKILKESRSVPFNGKLVTISSLEVDGIDVKDHPDYTDSYISYAEYEDGTPLTDEELDVFTDENSDLTQELAYYRAVGA